MEQYGKATIHPYQGFNPSADAQTLRKAMKGLGTNEQAIIDILCRRSNEQRQHIAVAFKQEFGRDLLSDLKSELGGKFETVILALMTPTADYDAKIVHDAMKGIGTDEDALVESLCTRFNVELAALKSSYQRLYGKNLEDAVSSELSGDLKRLMVMLLSGSRDEYTVDPTSAKRQAENLLKAGEGKLGTDEAMFYQTLAHLGWTQLHLVFQEYQNITSRSFEQAVNSELSGDLKKALLAITRCARSRPAYYAERLKDAMAGAGTKDDILIRIVVGRSEVDLGLIKEEFQRLYQKTLDSAIKSETSGDYKKALLAIVSQ